MPKYQSDAYWEKRSIQRLTGAEKSSVQYLKKIKNVYRSAAKSVVGTVKETYASYYRNDNTFSQELLEEIEPKGNITKFLNDMAKAGLNTSLPENFKGRMNRLKMLEAQLWAESKKVALQERNISTKSYEKTLTDTYYRTIYDIANGTGINSPFSTLNQKTIEKILESKFEGSNYSERIWKNTDILANSLQDILARAVATGQSPEKTIMEIMERFNVGYSNASRLVRTETNYFENKAELESYRELGIKKFKFLATLDERTSDICRSMDGKEFSVKNAMQGENVPPLHPYCRSTIVPVVDGFEPKERSMRNSMTGETENVQNMNYAEWNKKFGIGQEVSRIAAAGGPKPMLGKNNLDAIGVKQGAPMTQTEAMKGANPHYEGINGAPYSINCQRCVPTYEMRIRGYDVIANPNNKRGILNLSGKEFFVDPKTKKFPAVSQWEISPDRFIKQLAKQPDGRYGVLNVWKGSRRSGHTWVAEVKNGKVKFIDPQPGKRVPVDDYLSKSSRMAFYRMDNMQINGNNDIIKVFMRGKK